MNKSLLIPLLFFIMLALGFIFFSAGDKYKVEGEKHLANIKMLTDEGENAEAYLSFDEKKLIYQSSHGNIKCDQALVYHFQKARPV